MLERVKLSSGFSAARCHCCVVQTLGTSSAYQRNYGHEQGRADDGPDDREIGRADLNREQLRQAKLASEPHAQQCADKSQCD